LEPEVEYTGLGAREISPAQQLRRLSKYNAWGRFLIGHVPCEPMLLKLPPPPTPTNHRPHRLVTNSRLRFGRSRLRIEEAITRFLRR
jgi:hypothetical protein